MPNIIGYSTALFSTWYFVEEWGVLFDCGDGLTSGLLQKAGKIRHVFISHADRDHLAGLLRFNQLNAKSSLNIYYPSDCGSFPALQDFCNLFDPDAQQTNWHGIGPEDEIRVRDNLVVRPVINGHVEAPGKIKSLSYRVDSITRKLKPELREKSGAEIGALRQQHGEDFISDELRKTEMIFSGDTPIENDDRYRDARILIHEATFLTAKELEPRKPGRNLHSSLDQVMAMVANTNVQHLILGHFSSRYSYQQIDEAILKEIEKHKIQIPVSRVLPGMLGRDILGNLQVNQTI